MSDSEYKWLFVNQRMADMLGYARIEMIGKRASDFCDPEMFQKIKEMRSKLQQGRVADSEIMLRRKDGTELWTLYNATPLLNDAGEQTAVFVMHTDITERRQAAEALRESQRKALDLVTELEAANMNKNKFISILSHELRNPLAAIVSSISLLEITEDREDAQKTMEIMKRQTRQLSKLVDDLLDSTRISQNKLKLKKENTSLNQIVLNAVEDIKPEFEKKGVQLRIETAVQPVAVFADPIRMTQCFGNLLHNALKFTPENGVVTVSLAQEALEAVLRVKDNGRGIESGVFAQLFTPFMQADDSLDRHNNGGLGLGLSIVKGIIELHGGSVTADSGGLGKGALFTIRLPVADVCTAGPDAGPALACKKARQAYTMLIIDDNNDLADLLCANLRILGFKASAAYSGLAGLAMARINHPDIIFCDIGLPGKDGYEIAKMIKADKELKKAFLVAMTGYASDEDMKRAKTCGFDGHLAKPVEMAAIEKILAVFNA